MSNGKTRITGPEGSKHPGQKFRISSLSN